MKTHALNYIILYWKPCAFTFFLFLPLSGLYLVGYLILVAVITTWVTFVALQRFLQQNKPFDLAKRLGFKVTRRSANFDNRTAIKQLSLDIDRFFIEKWFIYISSDKLFNEECRVMLEEVLQKVFQVQLGLEKEVLLQAVLNLYLKHLKEFRRSLRRQEKYDGKVSDLYRYSHSCSTSKKAKDYFLHQLTITVLNHFINWELSNSLPYQTLASIISRKMVSYILNLLSNPEFINYYLLSICVSAAKRQELKLNDYNRVKIVQITEKGGLTPADLTKSISETNLTNDAKSGQNHELDAGKPPSQDTNIEEVKIYEPKSCKTWYDSLDLTSIPLGQDILDTLIVEDSDKDGEENEREEMSPITSAKNLLDEVKQMTSLEGFKSSMKPISDATANTLNNIKDFQESTVNNVYKPVSQVTSTALHRIGGLHLQDEAAGVMGGILDFGRTKIRKGLRLTGLQDTPEEASKLYRKPISKMPHVKTQDKSDDLETTWINPLQEETDKKMKIPSIQTESHEDGSPEPEYEEAADLATSIARLRSLLEQKSSESNMSTPAVSPMPPDDISNKILIMSDGSEETDGVMPSFYKFCAKTATGVIHNTLNTIKTALPGNVSDCDRYDSAEKWLFVEANTSDMDLSVRMDKLLNERKVFCTVDTAYEALDSLGSLQQNEKLLQANIQFEDELDDFEVKLPITKVIADIVCEVLADDKETSLTQEPVIKSFLLLFGNFIEESVNTNSNYFMNYACANAQIPSESRVEILSLELDEFIDGVLSGIPDYVKCIIGEKTIRSAANLLTSSFQIQRINQDLLLQIFEIVSLKLMDGSKQLTPISV